MRQLHSDDLTRNFHYPLDGVDPKEVERVYEELREEGIAALHEEGISPEDMCFERSTDMLYAGQGYSVNVRVRVEFVNLRLAAMARLIISD